MGQTELYEPENQNGRQTDKSGVAENTSTVHSKSFRNSS